MTEWRYLPGGKVKHALSYPAAAVAICGTGPAWYAAVYGWYGTGTQTEYETAAALPRCRRCVRVGRFDATQGDPAAPR